MHLAWKLFSLICLVRGQRETSSNFYKDVLCDLTERINGGCSMELVTTRSVFQCMSLCGRNKACIGASLDDQGMCFIHRQCPAVARTCTEWRKRGYTSDTTAIIDPDGPGEGTQDPGLVFCDMTSSGGIGVTVVGHNGQARTIVKGYEDPGSYRLNLIYNNIAFEQVVSLVDESQQCQQYLKWECQSAMIHFMTDNTHFTGWLNRIQQLTDYMGGASPGTHGCGCKVTGQCVTCNCDNDMIIWQSDDGYLTYKDDLPMYGFVAGDTGRSTEQGYHTIGELECSGIV